MYFTPKKAMTTLAVIAVASQTNVLGQDARPPMPMMPGMFPGPDGQMLPPWMAGRMPGSWNFPKPPTVPAATLTPASTSPATRGIPTPPGTNPNNNNNTPPPVPPFQGPMVPGMFPGPNGQMMLPPNFVGPFGVPPPMGFPVPQPQVFFGR